LAYANFREYSSIFFYFQCKFLFEKNNFPNTLALYFWNCFIPNLLPGYGSSHCASSIPKIPSTNLLFQPHPPNTNYASFLILYNALESHTKGSLFVRALALIVEGPGFEAHVESLWWSSSKVNGGPGNTYSVVASGAFASYGALKNV
jgi:hypothetical protein